MMPDLTLHELAATGDVKQIEAHVKLGKVSGINDQDEEYGMRMPLHIAAQTGHLRCCKFLLEGGADASARMSMGWTPAHCAAEGGHLAVIQLLAESGGTVNSKDEYGDTPKMIAKRYGHTECVQYLESLEELPERRKEILEETFQYAIRKKIQEGRLPVEDNGD